ncbi:MAG: sodium-dependent transporter, partial [Burkholderiales bacterium]
MTAQPEKWSGRIGFILATIGSAVGIGSIWKFPYEVGANGGSAFVLFYVVGLVLVVVPLMLAEFAIGRRGRADPSGSIAAVAQAAGANRRWAAAGLLGVLTGYLILSFYSVIGGWTIGYAVETALYGLPGADPQAVNARYEAFLASPWRMLAWHAVFMATATVVVARGVEKGIEIASKVLMPLLVALLLVLAGYSMIEGDLPATLRFLLKLDPQHLTARTALEALGLGFFSIGVGLGMMITYAAYSGAEIGLRQVAVVAVVADTFISLLAGLAVFPIVFAHGLDPASGPGLVFVTLPLAFAKMP